MRAVRAAASHLVAAQRSGTSNPPPFNITRVILFHDHNTNTFSKWSFLPPLSEIH